MKNYILQFFFTLAICLPVNYYFHSSANQKKPELLFQDIGKNTAQKATWNHTHLEKRIDAISQKMDHITILNDYDLLGIQQTLEIAKKNQQEKHQYDSNGEHRETANKHTSLEEIDNQTVLKISEEMDSLAQFLDHQEKHNDWALGMTEEIENTIGNYPGDSVQITALECKSTLCFMEVEHADDNSVTHFDLEFSKDMAGKFNTYLTSREEGSGGQLTTRVYMGRSGHEFPSSSLENTGL